MVRENFALLTEALRRCRVTKIGSDCLLMAYVHIGHDCLVGNNVILANGVQLGGHVEIQDYAIVGGLTPVHQFCKIESTHL